MDTINLLRRNIKLRFTNFFTILMTISQPLIWLVLYTGVAKYTMVDLGIDDYRVFILPGLIVLLILGTCASSGMMNYISKRNNSFYRILISPIKKSSIVLGQVLEGVLCSFLEVILLVLFSLILGVRFKFSLEFLLVFNLLVFLTSFFMASISFTISLYLPNELIYETFMNSLVLPLFFLSSALFPIDKLKGLLGFLVKLNPFTHIINNLRIIFLGARLQVNYFFYLVLVLLFLSIVSFHWATIKLEKERNL